MTLSRRSFFTGLTTLIATPAIVRAESLMKLAPTKIIRPFIGWDLASGADTTVLTRLDVLYGSMQIRPEWTAIVPELSIDDFTKRILQPMMNLMQSKITESIMANTAEMHGGLLARATNSYE